MTRSQEKLTHAQRDVLIVMGNVWKQAPAGSKSATLLSLKARGLVDCRSRVGAFSFDPWTSYAWQWRWTKKGERAASGLIFP